MARGTNVTFRSVFAVGEFRALWAAEALSYLGDQLARVALAILVFESTNSAALTGLTYALTLAPAFLGGIFLSGLADRFPRREVMIVADLSRALLVGLVAIPGMPFPVMCVLVAGVSFLSAPFKAAQLALLPAVLPGDMFLVGMGIRNITVQTAQMLGFAGGGLLISVVDPHVGLALDSLTFLASALLLRLGLKHRPAATKAVPENPGPEGSTKAKRQSFAGSARRGAVLIWRDGGLRVLVVFAWLSAFLIVYEGLAAPYTKEIGGGPVAVGLILAADPLGSVIGALIFSRWVAPDTRVRLVGPLAVASCLPLLPCFFAPGLAVSIALFAIAGALGTAVLMQASASFTLAVPDENRAQALGLWQSGVVTIQGVSPLLTGLLADNDNIGTTRTVGLVGVVGLVIAIPAAIAWRRRITAEPDRWKTPADNNK